MQRLEVLHDTQDATKQASICNIVRFVLSDTVCLTHINTSVIPYNTIPYYTV